MYPGRYQSGNMGHIDHEICPTAVGRLTEFLEIDNPGISRCSRNNQFGLDLFGHSDQSVIVDGLGFSAHLITVDFIQHTRKVDRMPVGQMTTVRQVHPHNFITRFQNREIDRHIGLRAGMRLDVGVVGLEKLYCPLAGEVFGHVDKFTTAVVPFTRIALGVLIGHNAAGGFENRLGDEILRCD